MSLGRYQRLRTAWFGFALFVLWLIKGHTVYAESQKEQNEIATLESLLVSVPDRAMVLYLLAQDYAAIGQRAKALALLKESASSHEGINPSNDTAFRDLRSIPEFRVIVSEVEHQYQPVHRAQTKIKLTENDLFPEGLAFDTTENAFYLSSLLHKKIVKFNFDGTSQEFGPRHSEDLLPICGVQVAQQDQSVWAAGCDESGKGELYRFNRMGELQERVVPAESGQHLLNDLAFVGDSLIYVTDSLASRVYCFDRNAHTFTALSFPRPLYYPNGIAVSADSKTLYIADAFGIFRYDREADVASELNRGVSNTLGGFDGLYWYHGDLVGVQNGIGLPRIVRVALSANGIDVQGIEVLEYRSTHVALPTTGVLKGSQFYFVENTQLDNLKMGRILNKKKLQPIRIGVVDLR